MTNNHHDTCLASVPTEHVSTCLTVTVGHREDGSLLTVVRFASGERLEATAGNPDLGVGEAHEVVHDAAHTVLACLLGLDRSPVLERVVDLRPLSQADVDLEEAATFALQAWCASLRGEDPTPHVANVRTAIDRSFSRARWD